MTVTSVERTVRTLVDAVLAELAGAVPLPQPTLELADPTAVPRVPGVVAPASAEGLRNLMETTTARIGVGRAGPRPRTAELLRFQADHAATQDALFSEVDQAVLDQFDLFTVQTKVSTREEYLLRPDLGRRLSDEGRAMIAERCRMAPDVQIVAADGLSSAAVSNNLGLIYPVLEEGLLAQGLSLGTPFFVRYGRVGVMNDVNDVVGAKVVLLLIGERPGLAVADALSVYSGWRPGPGKNDAHRDVVCMITQHGGTNPLEAGAYVVDHVRTVIRQQASGIELKLAQMEAR